MGFRFKKSYSFFQYPHVFCSRTLWKSNQRNSTFLYIFLLITEKPFEYTILKICQIRKISSHASYTSTERGTTSSDYHVTEYHAGVLRILINFLEQYFERFSHVYVATFPSRLSFLLGFLESSMQTILALRLKIRQCAAWYAAALPAIDVTCHKNREKERKTWFFSKLENIC